MERDMQTIISAVIREAMPGEAVGRALRGITFNEKGRLIVVSVGKAAWEMARAACEQVGNRIASGCVITKYGHTRGELPPLRIFEAGHPVPDENGYSATSYALSLVEGLSENDDVLFLLSGGGSALFEKPLVPPDEMTDITKQMLSCGAGITEINAVRKRLSAVKGGRFALACMPAHVYTVVLSDIIGDPVDMIASGPACPDASTCEQALSVIDKYGLRLSDTAMSLMRTETPKSLDNVSVFVTGSVKGLCRTAERVCRELGYEPVILTDELTCEARKAGEYLASAARQHQDTDRSLAFIAGGETVVHVTGNGLGGRNQEIALSAAAGIGNCRNTCVFSFGSDGTDGPTDAAGGCADEHTADALRQLGIDIDGVLKDNDSYHALQKANGLIITGPTGTNVNDLSVVLIKR